MELSDPKWPRRTTTPPRWHPWGLDLLKKKKKKKARKFFAACVPVLSWACFQFMCDEWGAQKTYFVCLNIGTRTEARWRSGCVLLAQDCPQVHDRADSRLYSDFWIQTGWDLLLEGFKYALSWAINLDVEIGKICQIVVCMGGESGTFKGL